MNVEAIANGRASVDPVFLKAKFEEVGIVGSFGWKYGAVVKNLKRENN